MSSSTRCRESLTDAQKIICGEIWRKTFETRVAFGVKFFKPEQVCGIYAKVSIESDSDWQGLEEYAQHTWRNILENSTVGQLASGWVA